MVAVIQINRCLRKLKLVQDELHPKADKLFCEDIDMGGGGAEGGGEPHQIASELREHCNQEEMANCKA